MKNWQKIETQPNWSDSMLLMNHPFTFAALIVGVTILCFNVAGCKPEKKMEKPPTNGKVYFVCRSEYEAPLGHRIVELPADSLLDWFQREWPDKKMREMILNPEQEGAWIKTEGKGEDIPIYNNDAISDYITKKLNGSVYGMLSVWQAMAKWGASPPQTAKEFEKFVAAIEYYGGPVAFNEHGLQVITDGDEIEIAWYLFDETFIKENPERTSFLSYPDWKLPETFSVNGQNIEGEFAELNPSGSKGNGCTYCVLISSQDGITIHDITGTFRFSGIRMPDLANHIKQASIPLVEMRWKEGLEPIWPSELLLTRALLQSIDSSDFGDFIKAVSLSQTHSEVWALARSASDRTFKDHTFLTGDKTKGKRDLTDLFKTLEPDPESKGYWRYSLQPLLTQISPHMCQVRFHHRVETEDEKKDWAHDDLKSFIFFDDLWIASNPILAKSILRYADRWDVLFDAQEE